jgi:mono/diheme cytochrome c family protein
MTHPYCAAALAAFAFLSAPLLAAPPFVTGDVVRLSKSEMLLFNGKDLQGAPKGQEFSVLKHDAIKRLVFVEYYKDDTLIAATLPAEALEKVGRENRNAPSHGALVRCRQALALHKLFEAKKYLTEGLAAEPNQPELKTFETSVEKDITEADGHHKNANSMRRFGAKGTIHALTAIEMGLKLCVDHPKLRALKKEMQGAFEERTSPPVTAAFLAAAHSNTPKEALEDGRHIYTTRCTECHDLELLDSRSLSAWRSIVGTMSRRAKVDDGQQARILDYLAAAQNGLDAVKPE